MNAIKRFVVSPDSFGKKKSVLLLLVSAFAFALPFMTKSLVSSTFVAGVFAIFGWCGLSALFVATFDFTKTLKRVSCSLFCFFYAFYFFVYSWFISLYPLTFAGFSKIESIGVILIPLTLIPLLHSAVMTAAVFVGYVLARRVNNSVFRVVLVSFGYVLGEYIQSVGIFAFPWTRLFVGQTALPSLLQTASLFGSYFVTFLMVVVNGFVAMCLLNKGKNKRKSMAFLMAAVIIFVANFTFGFVRMNTYDFSDDRQISALVLQGNIPSNEKWTGEVDEKEIYLNLANEVKDADADIAVLPETAFPVILFPYDDYDDDAENALMKMSKTLDAEVFTGAFNIENGNEYNSVFVYNPDGAVTKPYNKNHIVPFGEFLPYKSIIEKIFPVLAEINMLSSDLSRGEDFTPLETMSGKAACLVCFDSIFSDTARKQVKNGGEFIIVVTNDSWYKASSAIYQHADHAVMRAIENNRPVIRSANTGVSTIVDSKGRVVAKTKVNERTAMKSSVYIPEGMTLFTLIGDVFVYFCMAVFAAVYIFTIKKKPSA